MIFFVQLFFKQATFSALGIFFIFISRLRASPLSIAALVVSRITGLLDRVYLEAAPRLWPISLFSMLLVMPV